jgi:hypothetical protein
LLDAGVVCRESFSIEINEFHWAHKNRCQANESDFIGFSGKCGQKLERGDLSQYPMDTYAPLTGISVGELTSSEN